MIPFVSAMSPDFAASVCFEHLDGLPVYRLVRWKDQPQLLHAIFTRLGGVSAPPYATLNLSHSVGDDPRAVAANHRRVYAALDVRAEQVATCHLTHSTHAFVVTRLSQTGLLGKGDILVTAYPGIYLFMRFADCLPILLHDPVRNAVGLAHAGWRGTLQNVAGAAVRAMTDGLGCQAKDIQAVLGPGIGPCCYEVGEEVVRAARAVFADDQTVLRPAGTRKAFFDLRQANRQQLLAAGVGQVTIMNLCTACHPHIFFSHRAERGHTGRFGVIIGYRDGGSGN